MKGLDYVAINRGIADDPKIMTIAASMKKDRYWIAGHFPMFFGNVAEHAPDGELRFFTNQQLDAWAGGVRGFGSHVREHLCDATGKLSAWWKYNGRALQKLEGDRRRKRRKDDGSSTEFPGNLRAASAPLTVTDTVTDKETESPPSPNEVALHRHLPESCWPYLRSVLVRAREGSPGVALSIFQRLGLDPKAIPTGPGMTFATAEEMAEVLKRVAGSKGTGWSEPFVNGILVKLRQVPSAAGKPSGDDVYAMAMKAAS